MKRPDLTAVQCVRPGGKTVWAELSVAAPLDSAALADAAHREVVPDGPLPDGHLLVEPVERPDQGVRLCLLHTVRLVHPHGPDAAA
ncbi:hypothetical protein ACW14Y_42765 (plasmid) [Kitasatospora sp. cg17-2]